MIRHRWLGLGAQWPFARVTSQLFYSGGFGLTSSHLAVSFRYSGCASFHLVHATASANKVRDPARYSSPARPRPAHRLGGLCCQLGGNPPA